MALNFIDISSWQRGLNLQTVFELNDLDGVIVKATGGVSYVQQTCDPWVQWLIAHDKPWGFYHFLADDRKGSTGSEEAYWFVKNCENYFGYGVPVADYEGVAVSKGAAYLREFLDTVFFLTSVRPMVYCNLSTLQAETMGFQAIAQDYPLWLAQYKTNAKQVGFLSDPWQSGSVEPYKCITMQQYSSNGKLNGWDGGIDLDIFHGSRADWDKLVTESSALDLPEQLTPQTFFKHLNSIVDELNSLAEELQQLATDYEKTKE